MSKHRRSAQKSEQNKPVEKPIEYYSDLTSAQKFLIDVLFGIDSAIYQRKTIELQSLHEVSETIENAKILLHRAFIDRVNGAHMSFFGLDEKRESLCILL